MKGIDMIRNTLTGFTGLTTTKPLCTLLAAAALSVAGCATAPSMQDVDVVTDDTHIVYGSVDVFNAKGKRHDWGVGWTGHNYFYVTILPADSTEAITYRLDDDGTLRFDSADLGEPDAVGRGIGPRALERVRELAGTETAIDLFCRNPRCLADGRQIVPRPQKHRRSIFFPSWFGRRRAG